MPPVKAPKVFKLKPRVLGKPKVSGSGKPKVIGRFKVSDKPRVLGNLKVSSNPKVSVNPRVFGNQKLSANPKAISRPKASGKPKVFGKKRELKRSVRLRVDGQKRDHWPFHGQKTRYRQIFTTILRKDPINHLIKTKNKKPKVMVLGPGEGNYISNFSSELRSHNINPRIDVLGLQKTINPELLKRKIVRRDLSRGVALEDISGNPKANRRLISRIKGKYDLVMAPASVGLHTLYPALNVFNVSCMLKKGGVAYIEVPTKERVEYYDKFAIPEKHKRRMISQLDRLPKAVEKFLESYGGKKFSQEFRFSHVDHHDLLYAQNNSQKNLQNINIRYIKVERK